MLLLNLMMARFLVLWKIKEISNCNLAPKRYIINREKCNINRDNNYDVASLFLYKEIKFWGVLIFMDNLSVFIRKRKPSLMYNMPFVGKLFLITNLFLIGIQNSNLPSNRQTDYLTHRKNKYSTVYILYYPRTLLLI